MPADFGAIRRPWLGLDGVPVTLHLSATQTAAPFAAVTTQFSRLDARGFVFEATSCHGEADWLTATGALTLHDAEQSPIERIQMLQEALFAAAYADLLPRGGLLLHAATLWLGGRAYLIAGPSTAGKTTLCSRFFPHWWSDEHAFIERGGEVWHVLRHGEFRGNPGEFPWRAPVAGLFWLGPERDQTRVQPLSMNQAFERMLPQALMAGATTAAFVLDAVAHLCQHMPVQELSHCLTTPIAEVATAIAGGCHD